MLCHGHSHSPLNGLDSCGDKGNETAEVLSALACRPWLGCPSFGISRVTGEGERGLAKRWGNPAVKAAAACPADLGSFPLSLPADTTNGRL